jgi:glycosyltransferase involved in cell wall biosynthesis
MYIQTSKWEGMSIAVIQAMAAGIACVVNDCVGNRDAITHELTGLISTSDTAMAGYVLRLLDDPACRERMGLEARAVALRRFGRRAFGRRVMEVYGIADLRSAADLASADISDQATAAA